MWANLDPHKIVPPFKGTDARVSTSPSLYVQNVILESDRAKIIKNLETLAQSEKINYFCTRTAAVRRHKIIENVFSLLVREDGQGFSM
jgi:hypothetical protein